MPVGRFRKNPRELDEAERRVFAAQYPEGSLLFGMGVGLVLPMAAQATVEVPSLVGTLGTGFGPIVGGVVGYFLGHTYKRMRIESLRCESENEASESVPVSAEKES